MAKASLRFRALLLLCLLMAMGQARAAVTEAAAWSDYVNARFYYSICYPADVFKPQGEADNSDGQKFVAEDGARLIVYRSYNALGGKLSDILSETSGNLTGKTGDVTYQVLKKDWFVVSGKKDADLFYAKTFYDKSADQLTSFELA